ncbi:MAG: ATP-binding cassette domain-containing protein [Rhodospirillaceae bacterium]|nr:ATP-binding cassette domain-containing protein [Rhodospirillaceae bacterium]
MTLPACPVSIELDHLTRRFGALVAVDDVTFTVTRGEVVGLIGPNGAGKTTAMRMASGFLPPTAGRARICGADVQDRPLAARRALGYLPEGAPAYGDMAAGAYLRFIAGAQGLRGRTARAALDRVASLAGLAPVWRQRIDTLSKGYRRRVALAAALIHDPPALILDEPTDGLDPNQRHEMRNLIKTMAPDKAIVISTHMLEEVAAVCTRAVVIADGRIMADGKPEELARLSRINSLEDCFRTLTGAGKAAAAGCG